MTRDLLTEPNSSMDKKPPQQDEGVSASRPASNLSKSSSRDVERRFLEISELFDAGVRLTEERLRRQYPDATEADIARRLADWLHHHGDAAEFGDGPGRPVSAERLRRLRGG